LANFIEGSILSQTDLEKAMEGCDVVFHFAAKTLVEESVRKPELYKLVNVDGTRNVLEEMKKLNVKRIIFASTCAVYRASDTPLNENSPVEPTNPYGASKLRADQLISEYSKENKLSCFSLRFFNAAGAYHSPLTGWLEEKHNPETHLIPNLIESENKNSFKLFGSDWETIDGTAIRDYVHVIDIANACLNAASTLDQSTHTIINLGSNIGVSVKEIIMKYEEIKKTKLQYTVLGRRQGDTKMLVAESLYATNVLNWSPKYNINEIIQSVIDAKKEKNEV
jgi:UDP-glucose 4-epimerase